MRYSISNAIPHNPKSEKHPYENLVKLDFYGEFDAALCGAPALPVPAQPEYDRGYRFCALCARKRKRHALSVPQSVDKVIFSIVQCFARERA